MKLESQLQVSTASGVAPFTVNRNTLVSNLNAQYLNGQLGGYYAAASSLASYLPLAGGTLTGALNGTTGSFSGNLKGGRVTLRDDCLEQHVDDSDGVGIFVNYFGYNSGTTRFRNFGVFNGKNQQLLYITGSTGATAITGTLAVSSAITQGGNQVLHAGNYTTYAVDNSKRIKTFLWQGLGAAATQARRYEIARIGIDIVNWNAVGMMEIDLSEDYYSNGLKKKYTVWYGYNAPRSGLVLTEMSGFGANSFRVVLGAETQISGNQYYLPIYVEVRYYTAVSVRMTMGRLITTNSSPEAGYTYIIAAPTGTNIADFGADSVVNISNAATGWQVGGNVILHAGNYTSYGDATKLPLAGGTLTGRLTASYTDGTSGWGSIQIDAAPTSGAAYIRANRATAGTGEVGYAWATGGVNKWINYLNANSDTLGWYQGSASVMTLTTGGALTAASFSGLGTGLTGTATSLNIGGSATQFGGYTQDLQTVVGTGDYLLIRNQAASKISLASAASVATIVQGAASGSWGISVTGNAATVGSVSKVQLFNNTGIGHGTYTTFAALPEFGFYFMQGQSVADAPPAQAANQYYVVSMGLGNEYSYSQYAKQIALPRIAVGGGSDYLWIRERQATTWGSWGKVYAGYADSAGTATDATKLPLAGGTLTGNLALNTGVIFNRGSAPSITNIQCSIFNELNGISNAESLNSRAYGGFKWQYWDGSVTWMQLTSAGLTINGNNTLHAGNYNSYALPLSGGTLTGGLTITNLFGNANSASLYANTGSYGSWKIGGTRNNWYGIEFESGSNLMMNSNEVGFHRNGHGWQLWWSAGTAYCHKGNPGGGTQATILDSSNVASYALPIGGGALTGTLSIDTSGTAGASTVAIKRSGQGVVGFGSYAGSWRSALQIQSNANDRMLFFVPPEADYQYGVIRSVNGGLKIDVGGTTGNGGSNAISIETSGAVSMPGTLNVVGAVTQNGNQVLHAGNFSSYALPVGGTAANATNSAQLGGNASANFVQGEGSRGRSTGRTSGTANSLTDPSGFYFGSGVTGMPSGDWFNWINCIGNGWGAPDGYGYQLAYSFWSDDIRMRRLESGTWRSWVSLIHSGNIGSQTVATASNATQFGGEGNTNFMRGLPSGTEANLNTYTDNGFRSITYTGYSRNLLTFNPGGSTGTVQHEYFYNIPSSGWRVRNKTDNTTWSAWGNVVMTDTNQGALTGTVITTNSNTTVSGLNIGGNAASASSLAANTNTIFKVIRFTGEGYDSGNGAYPTNYGIYQEGGSWTYPYPDLCIGFHTGIKIGAQTGYGGIRFYNTETWGTEIFSVGNGDNNVRVVNTIYAAAFSGPLTGNVTGNLSGNVTGTAINIAGNGAGYDTCGTIGVTEPAGASNYSYYGLTRQSNIGCGFGLTGTNGALGLGANAFWFGSATSTAAGVMGSAYVAFNGSSLVAVGTVDATQFRDRDDVSYYLDPAGTSNLNKFSTLTMSYNDMNPMSASSPYVSRYGGSAGYRNGTMGYGYTDCNAMFSNWGSGFIDSWGSPANAPGGSSHYVGFQSLHYNHQNSVNGYGFQMLCAGEATNRFFWRSAWATLNSWVEMIHSGNIASQTVAVAGSCTGSAGSVAWTNVSGRPTAVSSFSNDSGYITSGSSISGSSGSCTGNAASVTDGVYLSTNQSIGGVKTFSSAPVATNIAKAWVHYNKSTTTITASYNVSSVTSNGTGVFTVNFTNAMVDTNYVVTGTATYGYDDQDIYGMALIVPRRSTAQQTGSCRLATEFLHAAQVYDCVAVRAVFYR